MSFSPNQDVHLILLPTDTRAQGELSHSVDEWMGALGALGSPGGVLPWRCRAAGPHAPSPRGAAAAQAPTDNPSTCRHPQEGGQGGRRGGARGRGGGAGAVGVRGGAGGVAGADCLAPAQRLPGLHHRRCPRPRPRRTPPLCPINLQVEQRPASPRGRFGGKVSPRQKSPLGQEHRKSPLGGQEHRKGPLGGQEHIAAAAAH